MIVEFGESLPCNLSMVATEVEKVNRNNQFLTPSVGYLYKRSPVLMEKF